MAAPIIQRPTKYWFADNYEGSEIDPNVGVAHTTEGTSLPWYDGGAKAPHYTGTPDFTKQRLVWTQHFPDTMSARALRNEAGGVETNTLNCIQIELVGTCDPATSKKWTAAGRQHIFWPQAPKWALDELAEFVALKHRQLGIRIEGPEQMGKAWAAYPASYGKGAKQRFSFTQWQNFYGWCGHQHVPENDHGDPGALPWAYIETKAKAIVAGPATKPPVTTTPTPAPGGTLSADDVAAVNAYTERRLDDYFTWMAQNLTQQLASLKAGQLDTTARLQRIEDDTDDGTAPAALTAAHILASADHPAFMDITSAKDALAASTNSTPEA